MLLDCSCSPQEPLSGLGRVLILCRISQWTVGNAGREAQPVLLPKTLCAHIPSLVLPQRSHRTPFPGAHLWLLSFGWEESRALASAECQSCHCSRSQWDLCFSEEVILVTKRSHLLLSSDPWRKNRMCSWAEGSFLKSVYRSRHVAGLQTGVCLHQHQPFPLAGIPVFFCLCLTSSRHTVILWFSHSVLKGASHCFM